MRIADWTEDMVGHLTTFYNKKTDKVLAGELGVSTRTINRVARQLGLFKPKPVKLRDMMALQVIELFETHSNREISKTLGVSARTVARIILEHGLKRSKQQERDIRSRRRKELIRLERARILFGLPQKTSIKVVTNNRRINLKSKLRKEGYIFHPVENWAYYHGGMKRHHIQEQNGIKLGIRFFHLSSYLEHIIDAEAA